MIALAVAALLSAGTPAAEVSSYDQAAFAAAVWDRARPQSPIIVAHRGCWSTAPENSVRSIEACAQIGVEAVENDVRLTKDGVPIIIHDKSFDRTTDGSGMVHDTLLADVKRLRLREGKGGAAAYVTQDRLPTLEDYLLAARDERRLVNLEIKTDPVHDAKAVFDASVAVARRLGVLHLIFFKIPDEGVGTGSDRRVIDTLDLRDLPYVMPIIWQDRRTLSQRLPEFERHAPLGYEIVFTDPAYLERDAADARLQDKEIMAIAVDGKWSGGLDDRLAATRPEEAWGRLLRAGATALMTDRPEALVAWLKSVGKR